MEPENIKLTQLRQAAPERPAFKVQDAYNSPDAFNEVRNNTYIEDQIRSNPELLASGNISSRYQRLNDLENRYDMINNKLRSVDTDIASEFSGRATAVGRRAEELSRARKLDSERAEILSYIEGLRGNITTSKRLAAEAAKLSETTSPAGVPLQGLPGSGEITLSGDATEVATVADVEQGERERQKLQAVSRKERKTLLINQLMSINPNYGIDELKSLNLRQLEELYESGAGVSQESDFIGPLEEGQTRQGVGAIVAPAQTGSLSGVDNILGSF